MIHGVGSRRKQCHIMGRMGGGGGSRGTGINNAKKWHWGGRGQGWAGIKLGGRWDVKMEVMDPLWYRKMGNWKGNRGEHGESMYGGGQQEQGEKGAFGTHLAKEIHMGLL
jgi:hypothetical protein